MSWSVYFAHFQSLVYHGFLLLSSCFHRAAAAAAKSLQSCPTLCDPIDSSPPGFPIPGFPGKNTGVGCHFLLQCMKVKSESEVAQSCPTLSDPMDCRLPGSFVHGFSRQEYWSGVSLPSPFTGQRFHLTCTSSSLRYQSNRFLCLQFSIGFSYIPGVTDTKLTSFF